MEVSIMPVVAGAAINGPPPPAPSIYKKAICLPSCDQRGRAAYPAKLVIFLGSVPPDSTVQSCFCSLSPAVEKTARVFESGDQAGSESVRSPALPILTMAGAFPDVSRT